MMQVSAQQSLEKQKPVELLCSDSVSFAQSVRVAPVGKKAIIFKRVQSLPVVVHAAFGCEPSNSH